MSDRHIFWSDIHLVLRMVQKYKFEERFFSCVIMVYPFIYERVNRYTVNFVVMLTTSERMVRCSWIGKAAVDAGSKP